jgi:hypothetical protein
MGIGHEDWPRAYQEMKIFGFIRVDNRGVLLMPTLL